MTALGSYKPTKVTGFVDEVYRDSFLARLVIDGQECEAEFKLSAWPTEKRALLEPGRYFTFPGKRGPRVIHVIDRPPVTKNRMKRARKWARDVERHIFEPEVGRP